MRTDSPYNTGLDKTTANFVPLTPLSFLERAARVYPEHISIIHGNQRFNWAKTYERSLRLASALRGASRRNDLEAGVMQFVVCAPLRPDGSLCVAIVIIVQRVRVAAAS